VVIFSAFGVTQTNRDESDWTSDDALVEQIDLASFNLTWSRSYSTRKSLTLWSKTCDTGVTDEDADQAQTQPPAGTTQTQRNALILIDKQGNLRDIELLEKSSFFRSLPPGNAYSPMDEQTVLSARKQW